MLLLGGVAVFFMSCEREALSGAGEAIVVNFSLSGEDYGASEVRGMAGRAISETVIVPLDDEFCMYATLAEDTTAELRALATIPVNTLIRIVAYNQGSTTPVANAEYKVLNATSGEIGPVSSGLTVPAPGNYDFVAYSLSSTTTAPTYSATLLQVSPENDLLWGKELNAPVSASGANVTIGMTHKFSQIWVVAKALGVTPTAPIGAISGVSITPGYETVLNVPTGAMGKGSGVTQNLVTTWSGINTTTVTANSSRLVFTAGEKPVSVKVGSIQVGVATYPDRVAAFDILLVAGRKYTFSVDFKRNLVWAGSNIYWVTVNGGAQSPGYLTFDAPSTASNTNQRKQGVLFYWGSLVGMGPKSAGSYFYNTGHFFPEFVSTSNKVWSNALYSNVLADMPCVDDAPANYDRFSTYLTDDARNTDNNYAYWKAKKGDICRYISENGYGPGGNYRMPASFEFGMSQYYYIGSDGWTATGSFGTDYEYFYGDGAATSWVSNSWGDVTFPTTGYFAGETGGGAGTGGAYWSSSQNDGHNPFCMAVNNVRVSSMANSGIRYAYAVRCVRAN
jgi:hypothetical protein